MKYVRLFEGFKEEDIQAICKKYGIENYTINNDGSIDVNDDVNLSYKNLSEIPVKFNRVQGYFDCGFNILTSLKGSPNYVDSFSCYENNILTFEGAPDYIGGKFWCHSNPIYKIWRLFEDYSKVELLNDYDVLRIEDGKGVCILSRLNGFLEDIR